MAKGMVAGMGLATASVVRPSGGIDAGKAKAARAAGVSPQRLSTALLVKEYAVHLAGAVIAGTLSLDAAFEQAKAIEKEAKWRDDGLRMLRVAASDIAVRVVDGEIDIEQGRQLTCGFLWPSCRITMSFPPL
jgi:hypothetical protein